MNRKPGLIVSLLLLAAMFSLSAWAWGQVPEGKCIAFHWGLTGRPDACGGKVQGLLLLPLIAAGVAVVLAVIPLIEPRRFYLWQSARAYNVAWVGVLGLLAAVHIAAVLSATGRPLDVTRVVWAAVGLLFVLLGNYLGKVRSNFFFGIRTPWTLSSEVSWNKTHRLGGRLFVAFGFVMLLTAWIGNPVLSVGVLLAGLGLVVAVPVAYSYVTWSQDPAKQTIGRGSS